MAYETFDKVKIKENYLCYTDQIVGKVSIRKSKDENSLASLVPVDFLLAAEPSIQMAMNVQSLEIDKLRTRESDEQLMKIEPIPRETIAAVVLTPGKIEKTKKRKKRRSKDDTSDKSKKRKKRKRKGDDDGGPPKKKKKRKKKSDVSQE
eukprot:CAMPEP_0206156266 /NCGR_PEP_ID=MMETSP1474-20131121/2837_1 /ASSEMBLY_ACC=CAM_ASM_001110 /TAXON_ID=97495 /ORGANISM="Imantonia sp., Strain RCC918" /LENGTH=148 /DNA_ID=CAMNT_0053555267 /DNA_START=1 /DNA_END=447 /DNA_ORIENTATION=-